jgi:hypothetical protein
MMFYCLQIASPSPLPIGFLHFGLEIDKTYQKWVQNLGFNSCSIIVNAYFYNFFFSVEMAIFPSVFEQNLIYLTVNYGSPE